MISSFSDWSTWEGEYLLECLITFLSDELQKYKNERKNEGWTFKNERDFFHSFLHQKKSSKEVEINASL